MVGVARDSKYNFIGEEPTPYIYQAATQVYQPQLSLFVNAARPEAVLSTRPLYRFAIVPNMPDQLPRLAALAESEDWN